MTDNANVALSKMNVEDAIEKLIAPTGNVIEVVKVANSALYALRYKNGGQLPDEYNLRSGKWTKPELAINDAKAYLRDFWEISEASKKKRDRSDSKQEA
jgi:hypothetical protein